MSRNRYELTVEQLALAKERQEKKLRQKEQAAVQQDPRGQILGREWLQFKESGDDNKPLRVMTWNVCILLHNNVPSVSSDKFVLLDPCSVSCP
jgi:hypothetical protein